ncbi:MAG TPA: hypothetical protein VL523_10050 [Terriglobia bacterium]|nr:hypothetical protein [Terriglobia bacterium]
MKPRNFFLLAALVAALFLPPVIRASQSDQVQSATSSERRAGIAFTDDFEAPGLDAWQLPFPEDWEILSQSGNRYLHMKRNREPAVPRRPVQFALRKSLNVGSFDFHARVRREGRSMIVVFNYGDGLHFYYAHLSKDRGTTQPVHNGVFLVNNAPRVRIAGLEAPPALPDTEWHRIRIARDVASGRISVWSDVQTGPLFTVVDRTFTCGAIGIGSFDETGDFDDVALESNDAGCAPRPVAGIVPADHSHHGRCSKDLSQP